MRVLITGAGGQLAGEFLAAFTPPRYDVLALDRPALDIADRAAVQDVVTSYQPHVIINAAAYNGVDDAEAHPLLAFAVNALGPRNLAVAARARPGTILVHFGTSYVFDGRATTPYGESDLPAPLSVYAASKLAGEHFVRAEAPRHYVLRLSTFFGPAGRRTRFRNFIDKVLERATTEGQVRMVTDQVVSPTYGPDIAAITQHLIEEERPAGLYHCVGMGTCSFYDLAQEVLAVAGIDAVLKPTTMADHGLPAQRPAYSALSTLALSACGAPVPRHWRQAVRAYLRVGQEMAPDLLPDSPWPRLLVDRTVVP